MKLNVKIYLLFLLSVIIFKSNAQTQQESFDYGTIDNNKYTNNFFAFEMMIPEGWVVQSKDQSDKIAAKGKEMVVGDNAQLKEMMDAAEVDVANLLMVYQFGLDSHVVFNPNISVISENIKKIPSINTGNDYLFEIRKTLEQSKIKYDYIDEDFQKEKINGTNFHKMNLGIHYNQQSIKQVYYVSIVKGFAFSAIISYTTNEQKQILLKALSTMKFSHK